MLQVPNLLGSCFLHCVWYCLDSRRINLGVFVGMFFLIVRIFLKTLNSIEVLILSRFETNARTAYFGGSQSADPEL